MMKKRMRILAFVAGGALLGLLYYTFWGCHGTCPISSSPWRTILYTGCIGFLLSVITAKETKE